MESVNSQQPQIRLGIICTKELSYWKSLLLEKLLECPNAQLELILELPRQHDTRKIAYFLYNALTRFENLSFKLKNRKSAYKLIQDLPDSITRIPLQSSKDGGQLHIEQQQVIEIKRHSLDLVIQLEDAVFTSSLLDTVKIGIWKYWYWTALIDKKWPPGVWEVLHRFKYNCTKLIMITKQQTYELSRSYSGTDYESIIKNNQRFLLKSISFILRNVELLSKCGPGSGRITKTILNDRKFLDIAYKIPKNGALLFPVTKHLFRFFVSRLQKRITKESWILMYGFRQSLKNDLSKFQKIIPPEDRFWADPFIIQDEGKFHVYFEEVINRKKGHISVLTIDEQGSPTSSGIAISKPYHLSYPFVFKWQDNWYMIPESSQNKTIEVYRCLELPYKWEFAKCLMKNIDAADTTLFYHDDLWWMFTNIRNFPGYPNWDELYLFYAKSPLSTDWTAHPMNPIVSDVRTARPAGQIFKSNGSLFRPAQNCSNRYGYGIKIKRIVELNTLNYQEQEVQSIEPHWEKRITATHTFNKSGDLSIIDAKYKRYRFF